MKKIAAFDKLSSVQIEAELNRIYRGPNGLEKIAALSLSPLQEDVLYESRLRQCFAEYKLAPGEIAYFDCDVRVPAVKLSVEGLPYFTDVKSNRVSLDTFGVSASALVRWQEAIQRKFDLLSWTSDRAKSSILEQEDSLSMSVIDAASTLYNPVISSSGKILVDKVAQAKGVIENNIRTPAVRMIMSCTRAADLAVPTATTGTTVANVFAPATQDELLAKGVQGSFLGLDIITVPKRQDGSSIIADDAVYVLGPAEYIGVMGIRAELDVKTQPALLQQADLISYYENIGYMVRYAKGIQKITIA
jgi:hypothetical protein